jgi:hypothetical protein
MGYLSLARLNVPPYDPASEFLEKTEEAFMKSGKLAARLFALIGRRANLSIAECLRMFFCWILSAFF